MCNQLNEEVWKTIRGSSGKYQVSNHGRVKNSKTLRILKGIKHKKGYLEVGIYTTNGQKRTKVHRLVATHFIDNPDNKPEVNHIDGDKENNHVSNLEWATPKENIRHAVKHGLISERKGQKHNNAKLTDEDVLSILELIHKGERLVDIGKKFDVDRTTISGIKHGKSWTHIARPVTSK